MFENTPPLKIFARILIVALAVGCALLFVNSDVSADWTQPAMTEYVKEPPFISAITPPLVMLVMGRNHKLYYEAYNDASDLNEDGVLDVTYKPDDIDYYGYFDSFKYYTYTNSRFEPAGTTTDKKAPSGAYWSGDFLNYLTMSRMDCIRKVLYGGYRSIDTTDETELERSYIPQDAHSWGKEYTSIAVNGYDISEYTPLELPEAGTHHLFANTSLSDAGAPLLRVLNDSRFRVWQWVAKEAPVVGDQCQTGNASATADCEVSAASTVWVTVTDSTPVYITDMTQTFYDATGHSSPEDHDDFDTMVATYGTEANQQGQRTVSSIDGSGNPYDADGEYYLSLFHGTLNIATAGTYTFSVDGDDAVEFLIDTDADGDFETDEVVVGWYGGHGLCSCNDYNGSVYLSAGTYTFEFRHEEATGNDNYYLRYARTVPASEIVDYNVRVLVAQSDMPESNCKNYPGGTLKPVGLLQRHGESDDMYFGLLSGSYDKNMSGGVLRKNIGSITDEINTDTGVFTSTVGIIHTIDKFRISDFNDGSYTYGAGWPDGWLATGTMSEGDFPDWGNPIGEMMYEALRYFGADDSSTATSAFLGSSMPQDDALGLPRPTWTNPYADAAIYCAKPFILTISDIYPTFDSDQLPGSSFSGQAAAAIGAAADALDVETVADTIFTNELSSGQYFIGDAGGTYDSGCSAKNVTGFGDVRGLCPEEPTKQGSYYSAAVAYYGHTQDLNSATDDQKVSTYAVGLASPLPKIEIPIQGQIVRLVPFAKTAGDNCSVSNLNIDSSQGAFQPTGAIVDFFVEDLQSHTGRFRINYEDVEQGADHDMDAIVLYEYQLVDSDGNAVTADTIDQAQSVRITLTSEYSSGCLIMHVGYIISGTTADGTYLEVKSLEADSDVDYFMDTPNTAGVSLPVVTTRTFTVDPEGGAVDASLLENPLWYAAKWGGFKEDSYDANGLPDQQKEWDKDGDSVPDNYFYVVNPLRLEQQLNRAFSSILENTSSATAASVISNSRSGEGALYQSLFFPVYRTDDGSAVEWAGQVHALFVDEYGNLREDTDQDQQLDALDDYFLVFDGATAKKYQDANENNILDADEVIANPPQVAFKDIKYLWSSTQWLNKNVADATTQRTYTSADDQRYIFTFVDKTGDMVVTNQTEIFDFVAPESDPAWSDLTSANDFYAYLHTHDPFSLEAVDSADLDEFKSAVARQTCREINFIRGQDQAEETVGDTTLPAMRSRQVDDDNDGETETWRLGDIVYSTPTIVSTPAEDFDLIYRDQTYTQFIKAHKNRRNVLYVGANDGMLHAFNAGFYDTANKKYRTQPLDADGNTITSITAYEIGSELWAYVPFNLLPHLYWLTKPEYQHIYYVDLQPRIFDARIYTDKDADDEVNPSGWATIMVAGMRFGGGKIAADIDKSDGAYDSDEDPTMSSAYAIFDITNPEAAPVLLAEVTFKELGFTTCHPGVFPLRNFDDNNEEQANKWFLFFGSGPASNDDSGVIGANKEALTDGISEQNAAIYALDLVALANEGVVRTITTGGATTEADPFFITQLSEDNSSVSKPIAVDWDLDFNTNAVYFGTSFGDHDNGWGGKLRRIYVTDDATDPTDMSSWYFDSVLLDLTDVPAVDAVTTNGQPVMAAATAGTDDEGNRWLFFGTGRFYSQDDKTDTSQQSFYAVKEPVTTATVDGVETKQFSYGTVGYDTLLDVSDVQVYNKDYTSFTATKIDIHDNYAGWRTNFPLAGERNIGQAVLSGDILTFTTYLPSTDVCEPSGESYLYAQHYLTGTAYFESVIGLTDAATANADGEDQYVMKRTSLGDGMTTTPNIQVSRGSTSEAFVQMGDGGIKKVEQGNPGIIKSGRAYWLPDVEKCYESEAAEE